MSTTTTEFLEKCGPKPVHSSMRGNRRQPRRSEFPRNYGIFRGGKAVARAFLAYGLMCIYTLDLREEVTSITLG